MSEQIDHLKHEATVRVKTLIEHRDYETLAVALIERRSFELEINKLKNKAMREALEEISDVCIMEWVEGDVIQKIVDKGLEGIGEEI